MDIRFNMTATVLNQFAGSNPAEDVGTHDLDTEVQGGHWETVQDELTGAVERIWMADAAVVEAPGTKPFNKNADGFITAINRFDIECYVRGFPEVGFRSSANTENWEDGVYKALESIQMSFPAKYILSRRQLITNIRGAHDKILWLEEETGQPTVFEVQGITPTFDPFGRHIDNLAVLKRSDVQ